MKKAICVFAALLLLLSVGCAGTVAPEANEPIEPAAEQATVTPEPTATETSEEASPAPAEPTEPNEPETEPTTGILVIYFSRTGEQYSVGVIDKGNTAIVAELIAQKTGADLFEVLPVDDHYPMTYNALTDVAKKEQNENARPAYQGELPNLDAYQTVFIGAPVWWGDWPMILYTVFDTNDFSGKTLVPFSTHEGSGLSGFDRKLQKACPDAAVANGLAVRGSDAQNNRDKVTESVESWLTELGF